MPSISSPMPGLPLGKPTGVPCPHLDRTLGCLLFGLPERPEVCRRLRPEPQMCGRSAEEAFALLWSLEVETRA